MSISVALHALAAVIWVGGMFFAHVLLRPSVACGSDCLARVAHLLCRHARTAPHAGTEHGQEEAA